MCTERDTHAHTKREKNREGQGFDDLLIITNSYNVLLTVV